MKKTVKDALQRIINILQSVSRFFHILLIAAYKRLLSNSFSKNIFDLLALTTAMYIGWLTSGNKIDFCSGLLIPVISLTIGITLRVGLHFYINAMLVNTGRKFIFSDTETANLIQDKDSLFFKLNLKIRSNITCSPTEYKARDEELDAIVKLNDEAFSHTIWKTEPKDFKKIIAKHVSANNKSIFVIYSADDPNKTAENIIGFTHVVAVNDYYWQRFNQGTIGNSDFKGSMIVRKKEKMKDDSAYGLIVLSIVLSKAHALKLKTGNKNTWKIEVGKQLTESLARQFDGYFQDEFKHKRIIPVAFHTLNHSLKKSFKGYKTNPKTYSKESSEIICFEIINERSKPLRVYKKKRKLSSIKTQKSKG